MKFIATSSLAAIFVISSTSTTFADVHGGGAPKKIAAKSPRKKRVRPLKVIQFGGRTHFPGSPFNGTPGLGHPQAWGFKMHTELHLIDNQIPPRLYKQGNVREHIEVLKSYGPPHPQDGSIPDWAAINAANHEWPDVESGGGHHGIIFDENALAFSFNTGSNPGSLWVTLYQTFYLDQVADGIPVHTVPTYVFGKPNLGYIELNSHTLAYYQGQYTRSPGF